MNNKNQIDWVSHGVQPNWKHEGWQVHRRNRTSGKARGGIIASGLSEYQAKTMVNDANRGSGCFGYRVVSPDGEIFSLALERYESVIGRFVKKLKLIEMREDDGRVVWEHFRTVIEEFEEL